MSSLSLLIVHHFAFSQNKQSILQSPFVNGILEYSFSQTHFMGKCVVALLAAINLILVIYEAIKNKNPHFCLYKPAYRANDKLDCHGLRMVVMK